MLVVMRVTLLAALALVGAALASAEEVFIPTVAQKQGQDGAWWNTEVWISNTTASTGGYAAVFLPGNRPNNLEELRQEPAMEDIPPRSTVYRNNLVPQGSVGALRIVTTAGVLVYARTFNAAGRGSSARGMPALSRSAAIRPGEIGYFIGLRRTAQYRTNVGLLNPGTEGGEVRLLLISQRGEVIGEQQLKLGPGAVLQVDEVLRSSFNVVRAESLRLELSGTVPFFAYALVVDARSNASTLILPLR